MYEERFKIISNGKLLSNIDKDIYIETAQKTFNITSNEALLLINGKKMVLKKGVSLDHAKSFKMKFLSLGLDVSVHVDLTKQSFLEGLIDTNFTSEEEASEDSYLSIRSYPVSPLVFAASKPYSISNKKSDNNYFQTNTAMGSPFLFFVVIFSVLHIQQYSILVMATRFDINEGLAFFGMVVLILGFLYFPKLITNKRNVRFDLGSELKSEYSFNAIKHLSLRSLEYEIWNKDRRIGRYVRDRFKKADIKFIDDNSMTLYSLIDGDIDFVHESAAEASGNVFNFHFLDFLSTLSQIRNVATDIKNSTAKRGRLIFIIRDSEKEVVAKIYKGNDVLIKMTRSDNSLDEQAILFMMGVMSAGLR